MREAKLCNQMQPPMTSSDELHRIIRSSYSEPNYQYLQEVRDATGYDAVRTADAIAIGMYRSCGRKIHGFEIKVSRTDWLKEISNAAKSESLFRYCHRWALVISDESYVHPGELPDGWGMAVPHVSRKGARPKLRWVKHAPLLEPKLPDMVFITALLYATQRTVKGEKEVHERWDEAYRKGKADALATRDGRRDIADQLASITAAVEAFEKQSQVHISSYTGVREAKETGLEFREWRQCNGSLDAAIRRLERLERDGGEVVEHMRERLGEIIKKAKQ